MSGKSLRGIGSGLAIMSGILMVCLLGWAAMPNFCGSKHSKRKMIVNNLYRINGAKAAWQLEHGLTSSAQLTWEDLQPYLHDPATHHGVLPVAGEVYEINTVDTGPQAVLTRKLENLPRGTIIRLDREAAAYDMP
jgi:hypothetical protein